MDNPVTVVTSHVPTIAPESVASIQRVVHEYNTAYRHVKRIVSDVGDFYDNDRLEVLANASPGGIIPSVLADMLIGIPSRVSRMIIQSTIGASNERAEFLQSFYADR